MEVNKLESREVLTILFGVPVMITVIVLVSIAVGHVVTTRSDRPTNVQVSAASPRIDVNVPQSAPPNVQVATPRIDVTVPQAAVPTINVTPPPAVVTVLERQPNGEVKAAVPEQKPIAKPEKSAEPVKAPAVPVIPSKTAETAKTSVLIQAKAPAAEFKTDDLTVDTLYQYAEKYIASYCAKNGLDSHTEASAWNKKWKQGLDQALADNIDSDEQTYINRIVVAKRDCFDLEKATPEKIVEGCRIMLRYRDGKLSMLKQMSDAATEENLKKTLVFLAAGVR